MTAEVVEPRAAYKAFLPVFVSMLFHNDKFSAAAHKCTQTTPSRTGSRQHGFFRDRQVPWSTAEGLLAPRHLDRVCVVGKMGGKTWSREEELYFWRVIVPLSPKAAVPTGKPLDWEQLSMDMQRHFGANARRRYTNLMLCTVSSPPANVERC